MGLGTEISNAVKTTVDTPWDIREGQVVPSTNTVALKNGGVRVDAVYLYADMADSTGLARDFPQETAAKVIRAYLSATCKVIGAHDGEIRSFDGDRVMAIFMGSYKNTSAAKCALKLKWAVDNIVRPAVEAKFPSLVTKGYKVSHCTGIASGSALIVRGGVRGDNDLISVGRPPNVAAKLSEIRAGKYRTYITSAVFNKLADEAKNSEGTSMWEAVSREVGGEKMTLYKSSWGWKL